MHVHVKARETFFHAVRFIPQHISFTVYYFFLMAVSELIQVARSINMRSATQNVLTVGENKFQQVTDYGVIVKKLLPESFINFLQQPYIPYLLFMLSFIFLFLFMGITFIAQALLRKRDTTFLHETSHSFSALIRAPWAIVYLLGFAAYSSLFHYVIPAPTGEASLLPFFVVLFLFLVVGIALVYYQQLLYDNYHSLPSVVQTSWEYLKKSWFVLLKYFLLIGLLNVLVMFPTLFSGIFLPDTTLILAIGFLLRAYFALVGVVGFNMIYLHVRS